MAGSWVINIVKCTQSIIQSKDLLSKKKSLSDLTPLIQRAFLSIPPLVDFILLQQVAGEGTSYKMLVNIIISYRMFPLPHNLSLHR